MTCLQFQIEFGATSEGPHQPPLVWNSISNTIRILNASNSSQIKKGIQLQIYDPYRGYRGIGSGERGWRATSAVQKTKLVHFRGSAQGELPIRPWWLVGPPKKRCPIVAGFFTLGDGRGGRTHFSDSEASGR